MKSLKNPDHVKSKSTHGFSKDKKELVFNEVLKVKAMDSKRWQNINKDIEASDASLTNSKNCF